MTATNDTPAGAVRSWLTSVATGDIEDAWALSTLELRLVLVTMLGGADVARLAELGPGHPRWCDLTSMVRTRFAGDGGAALARFVNGAEAHTRPWRDLAAVVVDEDGDEVLVVPEWYVVTLANGPRALRFTVTHRVGIEQRRVRWRLGAPGTVPRHVDDLASLARSAARAAESPLEAILRRAAGA